MTMSGPERKTIFIDLDDTIVDTFGLLLAPLERKAAQAICELGGSPFTVDRLTDILLDLRRKAPDELRERLRELSKFDADRVMHVRDEAFSGLSIENLE